MQHIVFTVTTDLSYDQRMIRICSSLANAGYEVTLVGRKRKNSIAILPANYKQKRLFCFFDKGKLFYAEYNFRLFFYLLFLKCTAICAIDLDTIIPVYYSTLINGKKRIYDAHELFCEMKEIVTRPAIYKFWKKVEQHFVPKFPLGYTVNEPIALEFKKMYGNNYEIVRNIAEKKNITEVQNKEKYILYQGAINEGRCFETLIPAMLQVDARLILCGDGNFMAETKALVAKYNLQEKVVFKNMLSPASLWPFTEAAYIGLTLVEDNGLSNYYSLANRFFDYIHGYTPQICINFPVYRQLNEVHKVAVLIDNTDSQTIANAINELLTNQKLWDELHANCKLAAQEWNWEKEEKTLINYYNHSVFG